MASLPVISDYDVISLGGLSAELPTARLNNPVLTGCR